MEYRKEVNKELRKENVDLLIENTKHAKIKMQHMKDIAILMNFEVNGVYEQMKSECSPDSLMRHMLDKWYTVILHKTDVDGVQELIKILRDENVGLLPLALKMEKNQGQQ